MVDRSLCMREVRGSIPRISMLFFIYIYFCFFNFYFSIKSELNLKFIIK